jgi:hypothetical protein
MIARVEKPATRVHFPLRRLALCLDCDECFEIGSPTCPACGSKTAASLARFLERAPAEPLHRLLHGPRQHRPSAGRRESERQIARQLFVIARDRRKLYEYVKQAFAGNPNVEVVLDRRTGERRQDRGARIPDRRGTDRRADRRTEDQLRALGWAIVLQDLSQAHRAATVLRPNEARAQRVGEIRPGRD